MSPCDSLAIAMAVAHVAEQRLMTAILIVAACGVGAVILHHIVELAKMWGRL